MPYNRPKEPNRSKVEVLDQAQLKLTAQCEKFSAKQIGEIINQLLVIKQEKEGVEQEIKEVLEQVDEVISYIDREFINFFINNPNFTECSDPAFPKEKVLRHINAWTVNLIRELQLLKTRIESGSYKSTEVTTKFLDFKQNTLDKINLEYFDPLNNFDKHNELLSLYQDLFKFIKLSPDNKLYITISKEEMLDKIKYYYPILIYDNFVSVESEIKQAFL